MTVENLADLPRHDWREIAREIARPSLTLGASVGVEKSESAKKPRKTKAEKNRPSFKEARAWTTMGVKVVGILAVADGVGGGLRMVGKAAKISAFARLADQLKNMGESRLVAVLERATDTVGAARMAVIEKQGPEAAQKRALEMLAHGDAPDAAELFLRCPFDPRVKAGLSREFQEAREKWREYGKESGARGEINEALIQSAIERAKALQEAIELIGVQTGVQTAAAEKIDTAQPASKNAPARSELPRKANRL